MVDIKHYLEMENKLNDFIAGWGLYVLNPKEGVWTVEEIPGDGVLKTCANRADAYISALNIVVRFTVQETI